MALFLLWFCSRHLEVLLQLCVMRHASTLLKCFAVSISICACTVISILQGDEELSLQLSSGILVVNIATFIYGT